MQKEIYVVSAEAEKKQQTTPARYQKRVIAEPTLYSTSVALNLFQGLVVFEQVSAVSTPVVKPLFNKVIPERLRRESSTHPPLRRLPLSITPVIPASRRPCSSSFRPLRHSQSGFTLIELLVVVLIIGILAAIALPQYQKAVEKAKMTEAVTLVRAIANAHQLYYMANGQYLNHTEIDKLDIEIPGTVNVQWGPNRIQTQDFIYSPNGDSAYFIGLAQRVSVDPAKPSVYQIYITQESPQEIHCTTLENATSIQRKLCTELNANGTL